MFELEIKYKKKQQINLSSKFSVTIPTTLQTLCLAQEAQNRDDHNGILISKRNLFLLIFSAST